jgi:hypothetical protein
VHIQIVTFHLDGLSDDDYQRGCAEGAAAFAAVPGLIAKVWLADPASNTYGGVITWRDRQAMQEFQASALFQAIVADPHLVDVSAVDFAVLEAPTRVTHGLAAVAA